MTRQQPGDDERLSREDIEFLRQMRRDWEGSTRLACWGWRLFLALGAAGAAIAGLLAGLKALSSMNGGTH